MPRTLIALAVFPLVVLLGAVLGAPSVAEAQWVVCTPDVDRWVCGEHPLTDRPTWGSMACGGDRFPDATSGACLDVPCSCGDIGRAPTCEEACLCSGVPMPQTNPKGSLYYIWPCDVATVDAGVRDAGMVGLDGGAVRPTDGGMGTARDGGMNAEPDGAVVRPDAGRMDASSPRADGGDTRPPPGAALASFRGAGGCTCHAAATAPAQPWTAAGPILIVLSALTRRRRRR